MGHRPPQVSPGSFTLTLNGAYFGEKVAVWFGNQRPQVKWISSTKLRATGTATADQVGTRVVVQVEATGLGAVLSDVAA